VNKEQYDAEIKELNRVHQNKVYELTKEYYLSSVSYKIGDVIKDSVGSGMIMSIEFFIKYLGEPGILFQCKNLTKKGEVNKREPLRKIYLENIVKE
jgi:hypothetical protein